MWISGDIDAYNSEWQEKTKDWGKYDRRNAALDGGRQRNDERRQGALGRSYHGGRYDRTPALENTPDVYKRSNRRH